MFVTRQAQSSHQSPVRHELDRLIGEIETGFEIGQQVDEIPPQHDNLRRKPSRQLVEGRLQLAVVTGVDYAQNRLGLGQVDPPGEKGAQSEFAGLGRAYLAREKLRQNGFENRRRRNRVQFGERLSGITPAVRPEIKVGWQRQAQARNAKLTGTAPGDRLRELRFVTIARRKNCLDHCSCPHAAHANDAPRRVSCS